MSCLSVELPGLGWLNAQGFEGAKAQQKITSMSCVVAGSSPVLGSCRSPSVSNLHDNDIEIRGGSPLRSPLQGFQTPRSVRIGCRCKDSFVCSCSEDKNKFLVARTPIALHESRGIDSSGSIISGSPVRQAAVVNSLRQVSLLKNSPPQESLASINRFSPSPSRNSLQTNFPASRLRPVLALRDDNHQSNLWNESSSPVKQEGAFGFCQRPSQRIVPVNTRVKEEGCEGLPWKLPSENGGEENLKPQLKPQPPSPPLKRKRPPRLYIPQDPTLQAMSLNDEEHPTEINIEGSHYAVSCKKGRREFMEDTHKATLDILGDTKQAFFGVFDGHGGRKAADFAAENIGQNILDAVANLGKGNEDHIEQAVRAGYLATDAEFLKQGVSGGTSCVTALIRDGNLVVSNAGDCRAVISRDGKAEALTCDHRAAREDERERIENLGGYVDCRHGVWRVQGVLAVSRGIGDLHMKEWISAEPDTKELQITSDCEFLILASDGLWDKVSNQEAVDLARPFCMERHINTSTPEFFEPGVFNKNIILSPHARGDSSVRANDDSNPALRAKASGLNGTSGIEVSDENDPKGNFKGLQLLPLGGPMAACKKLVELSIARGSLDDVSVLIVELRHFGRKKT